VAQTLSGTKTGVLSQTITCNSVQAALALTPNGSAGPAWGVTAPAGLTVTAIASNVFTVANSFSAAPGCGGSGTNGAISTSDIVGVYWTTAAGSYYNCGCTVSAAGATSVTLTGGTYAGNTALPTTLTGITSIMLVPGQKVTSDVSIVYSALQQMLAVSTQIGAVEWYDGANIERVSFFQTASNGGITFDTWPTTYPSTSNPFTGTITTLYFYNFSVTVSATMQATVILT
jgi:hypothetical protein